MRLPYASGNPRTGQGKPCDAMRARRWVTDREAASDDSTATQLGAKTRTPLTGRSACATRAREAMKFARPATKFAVLAIAGVTVLAASARAPPAAAAGDRRPVRRLRHRARGKRHAPRRHGHRGRAARCHPELDPSRSPRAPITPSIRRSRSSTRCGGRCTGSSMASRPRRLRR